MVFYPPHFELPKRKSNKNSPINSVSPEVASCGSLTPFIEFSATPAVFRSCFTAVKLKKTTILTLYLSIYLSIQLSIVSKFTFLPRSACIRYSCCVLHPISFCFPLLQLIFQPNALVQTQCGQNTKIKTVAFW